jgi:hypothetical protein
VAQGGTLFLDEIGELPLSMQAKLLRFLQNGEVQRLGSTDVDRVDVCVVCATNVRLPDLLRPADSARTFITALRFFLLPCRCANASKISALFPSVSWISSRRKAVFPANICQSAL